MLYWHSPEWTVHYYFSQYWYQTNQSVLLYIIFLIYWDHVGNHQLFDICSDCQSVLKIILLVVRELIHFKTPGWSYPCVGLKTFLVWRFNRCDFTFWFVSFDKLFWMFLLFKHIVWGIAVLLDTRGCILSPSLRNPVILHIVCLSHWGNSI